MDGHLLCGDGCEDAYNVDLTQRRLEGRVPSREACQVPRLVPVHTPPQKLIRVQRLDLDFSQIEIRLLALSTP